MCNINIKKLLKKKKSPEGHKRNEEITLTQYYKNVKLPSLK